MTRDRTLRQRVVLRTAVVGFAGLAVLLAATLASAGPSEPAAGTASPTQAPEPDPPRLTPAELRLAAWPGLRGDLARDEVIYAEEYRAREQLIRSCMREHGFTYVPIPLQYGPTAPGYQEDPNRRIVSGLSPEEQRSYHLALSNSTGPDEVSPGFDLQAPGGAGCLGEAHQALPGIFRVPAELEGAVAQTRALALRDPGVEGAMGQWRSCVTTQLGGVAPAGLEEPSDITRLSDLGLTNGPGEPTLVELDQASERCRSGLDQALEAARERAEAAFVRAHHPALVAHRESLIADHERFGLSVAELW